MDLYTNNIKREIIEIYANLIQWDSGAGDWYIYMK